MLRDVDDYAGKYYSHEWIRRNVLYQTEEDMEQIDKQIADEIDNPQYAPPEMGPDGQPLPPGDVGTPPTEDDATPPAPGKSKAKATSIPNVPDLVGK
jgi:hypothetical protein